VIQKARMIRAAMEEKLSFMIRLRYKDDVD